MMTAPGEVGAAAGLTDWMGSLPPSLHEVPLNKLCIPGSHNSGSFWLDTESPTSATCPPLISNLCTLFGPGTKQILRNWALCQTLNWTEQLEAGVRYFDLRVTTKPESQDIYYEHSLYGDKVNQSFLDIHSFLQSHPKEIVLLDFRHLTEMSDEAHERLISLIRTSFGSLLCPRDDIQSLSLSKLCKSGKRVMVFYHHQIAERYADLWPGEKISAPWANEDDPQKVISFLEALHTEGLPGETLHVTQCIITPSPNMIMGNMASSLRDHATGTMAPLVSEWLKSKKDVGNAINVCTSDFVDFSDFISLVIGLNRL